MTILSSQLRNEKLAPSSMLSRYCLGGAGGARPLSVGVILARNFTLSSLSCFVDALRLAADEGDLSRPIRCRWTIMGGVKQKPVRSSCGIDIAPWTVLQNPKSFHYVAVVGGLLQGGVQVDDEIIDYLHAAALAGVPLIGLCTGSFVLARAGLMEGRKCCVDISVREAFEREFPHIELVSNQRFIADHDRLTCSGGIAVVELATCLIKHHCGQPLARKVASLFQNEGCPLGADWLFKRGLQTPPPDTLVGRVIRIMEENVSDPLKIEALAERVNASLDRLEDHFGKTFGIPPVTFYQELRLHHALWLVLNSDMALGEIARASGFRHQSTFSAQFRSSFGLTPSAARAGQPVRSDVATTALPQPGSSAWLDSVLERRIEF
jgi:transcriptional regulator GlxA family with amidase domain